jgi:hypothetical protein
VCGYFLRRVTRYEPSTLLQFWSSGRQPSFNGARLVVLLDTGVADGPESKSNDGQGQKIMQVSHDMDGNIASMRQETPRKEKSVEVRV